MEIPLSLTHPKFPPIPTQIHDSKHWNSIIKHHTRSKDDGSILATYTQMESLGVLPDDVTLPLVLKACGRLRAIEKGKNIHEAISSTGLISDVRVQTAFVGFYSKCGMLEDARQVFDEMPERDVVSWNAMISGCVSCFDHAQALRLFSRMQDRNLRPNSVTVVELLRACGELSEWRHGQAIHGYSLRNGLFDSNPHVGTSLMGFYTRFDPYIASLVFKTMASRNTVSWNAMINGYVDNGDHLKALQLFVTMMKDGFYCDSVTMLVVLQACAEHRDLKLGTQVHQLAVKLGFRRDMYVVTALMNMYSKSADSRSSYHLFNSIPTRDVALWNSMLSCYVESESADEATSLLREMQSEGVGINERTLVIMLPLCDGLANGKSLHAHAIKIGLEKNVHVGTSLLNLYASLNRLDDATRVFRTVEDAGVVSWNVFVSALTRNKSKFRAWEVFTRMLESGVEPDSRTVTSILAVCDGETDPNVGRSVHGYAVKRGIGIDASLNTALTEMYVRCGGGDESTGRDLFEEYPDKDVVSWNSLMSTYVENDRAHEALLLFHEMIATVTPNAVTIVNVLSSCTRLSNLPQGRCLHAYVVRRFGFDVSIGNAFISMYARCGSMRYAENVFRTLPKRNVVSWNAMISGYGMHGRGADAMSTFSRMLENGLEPDRITFVSVLSACSHSGSIRDGLRLFRSMARDFGVAPELVHYACVVDLLARGGRLTVAKNVIDTMPVAPDASVWRALLGACRVHHDTGLAETAFERLVELEPANAGNFVLMSNVYASAGRWDDARRLRSVLETDGLKKPPGGSWIVIRGELHRFAAGDKSHPQSERVYEKLASLLALARGIGYVPDLRWVLHDEDDERKTARLSSHSEKLAMAFGLINVTRGSPILVTKNLRVCGDCHEFSKYVSRVSGRAIVLRDGSRFHHFANGVCSCDDYW